MSVFLEGDASDSDYDDDDDNDDDTGAGNLGFDSDDEFFIKLESRNKRDNVDFIMLGSTCYANPDSANCAHDILIHFCNSDIDERIMNKKELRKLFQTYDIIISSNTISENSLQHLLA